MTILLSVRSNKQLRNGRRSSTRNLAKATLPALLQYGVRAQENF